MEEEPTTDFALAENQLENSLDEFLQNKSQESNTKQAIYNMIYILIPKEEWNQLIDQMKLIPKSVCAANIVQGELSFKCLDCGFENEFHIFCEKCFMEGEHKGHRIQSDTERGGCCDCGDQDAINQIGFCKSHKGYSHINKEKSLENVSADLIDRFNLIFQTLLYKAFWHAEISQVSTDEKQKQISKEYGDFLIMEIFKFITAEIIVHIGLVFMITEVLMNSFNLKLNSELLHDCKNYQFNDFSGGQPHKFLDQLLKLQSQELIYKDAYEGFLSIINYFYLLNKQKDAIQAKLEETNFFLIYMKIICCQVPTKAINQDQQRQLAHSYSILIKYFSEFLSIAYYNNLEKKQKLILELIDFSLNFTDQYLNNSQQASDIDFITKLNDFYFLQENNFRICCILMVTLLKTVNEDISEFCKLLGKLHNSQLFLQLFHRVLSGIKQAQFVDEKYTSEVPESPFMQYSYNKYLHEEFYKSNFTLFYDIDSCLLQLITVFSNSTEIFNKITEVFELQSEFNVQKSNMMEIEENKESENEIYVNIFKKLEANKKLQNLENMLNNSIQMCNREICYINVTSFTTIDCLNNPCLIRNSWGENSLEFILINMFMLQQAYEFSQLKALTERKFLSKKINIENCIQNVAVINEKTKQFKLKAEFQDVIYYDPYIFGKTPKLNSEIMPFFKNSLFSIIQVKFAENQEFIELLLHIFLTVKDLGIQFHSQSDILRHAIKLLHILMKNFLDTQINTYFINRLVQVSDELKKSIDFILAQQNLSDYYNSLKKIMQVLMQIQQKFSKENVIVENQQQTTKEIDINKQRKLDIQLRKQKQIELIKQKQKNFMQNIIKDNEDSEQYFSEKKENDDQICISCHQADFSSENPLGFASYISKDNLSKYYYFQQSNKIDKMEETNLMTILTGKVDQFSHKKPEFNYSLKTCTHILHKKCQENMVSKSNLSQGRKQLLFKPETVELEYFCPQCNSISNILVPNIDILFEQKIINHQIQSSQNDPSSVQQIPHLVEKIQYNNLSRKEVITNLKEEESILKNLTDFFDRLLFVTILESDDINENIVLKMLYDSLIYMSEQIFMNGLQHYLRKTKTICRNTYLSFKLQFWNFDSPSLTQFIQEFKLNFIVEIKQNLFQVQKNKNYDSIFFGLDLQLIKLIWSIAVIELLDENFLQHCIILICKTFINKLIIIYTYSFLMNQSNNKGKITVQMIYETWSQNQEFRIKILSFLKPYYELILGLFLTIFKFDPDVVQKIEKDNKNSEYEQIQDLANFFGQNIFMLNEDFLKEFGAIWVKQLNELQPCDQEKLQLEIYKNPCIKFKSIQLDKSYVEMNNRLIFNLCSICKHFPRRENSDLHLCLICGTIVCSRSCAIGFNHMGNLNSHSQEFHCGKTVYINLNTTVGLFLDSPKIAVHQPLYFDNLGQKFHKDAVKWDKYFLDRNSYQKIEEYIRNRQISHEIIYRILKNQNLGMNSYQI